MRNRSWTRVCFDAPVWVGGRALPWRERPLEPRTLQVRDERNLKKAGNLDRSAA